MPASAPAFPRKNASWSALTLNQGWPALENASHDARAIDKMLRKKFRTVLLLGKEATYRRVWRRSRESTGARSYCLFTGTYAEAPCRRS